MWLVLTNSCKSPTQNWWGDQGKHIAIHHLQQCHLSLRSTDNDICTRIYIHLYSKREIKCDVKVSHITIWYFNGIKYLKFQCMVWIIPNVYMGAWLTLWFSLTIAYHLTSYCQNKYGFIVSVEKTVSYGNIVIIKLCSFYTLLSMLLSVKSPTSCSVKERD